MSASNIQQSHLPPKAKYQRSHKRSICQQIEEEDYEQPSSSGDEEEPRLGWTVGQHSSKQLKLNTSVTDGVGHPRSEAKSTGCLLQDTAFTVLCCKYGYVSWVSMSALLRQQQVTLVTHACNAHGPFSR
jgi:hypothetical protein